ncbi:DUF4333 domain-containing protein [Nocardia alba]|uniref:Uncharacterized protein DUF4333 n=1 Tax=Nocardia alba TaxID=225051 RepID=A0A4R1FPS2_9NOCA|nr:DUF4333 domain-containing protein [Nocardia alba]TCJ95439.1 uncharacterized protein DUF4333 [Nocardia alba]
MSGPYGPNNPGEGNNDPTQHWGGQQGAGAGPTQHWGGAQQPPPQGAQPTQQWNDPNAQQPQQQWGQQPQQPQQWGQQPQQPTGPQQQWGQTQPPPQDWNNQAANAQQQWGQPAPQQQWGQQPAPQQQWGQPQQSSGGKSKGLVIGLVAAGVLVVAAVIGLLLVVFSSDELDNAAVQQGVARVLKDSYGIADVSDVSCPSGQAVEVDATFTCDLKVSGEAKKVTVKITKEDGTYEVGRPN